MVPPSKILTVSYGTFSCTLEGFDDPFTAMTEIAEYFRDLAAEDRYFGAEPPTLDAAMLQQIAENSSKRAVSAHSDGTNVVLRPADDDTGAPALGPLGNAVTAAVVSGGTDQARAKALQDTIEHEAAMEEVIEDAVSRETITDEIVFAGPERPKAEPSDEDSSDQEAPAEDAETAETDMAEDGDAGTFDPSTAHEEAISSLSDAFDDEDSAAAKLARIRNVVAAGTLSDDADMSAASGDTNAAAEAMLTDNGADAPAADTVSAGLAALFADVDDAEETTDVETSEASDETGPTPEAHGDADQDAAPADENDTQDAVEAAAAVEDTQDDGDDGDDADIKAEIAEALPPVETSGEDASDMELVKALANELASAPAKSSEEETPEVTASDDDAIIDPEVDADPAEAVVDTEIPEDVAARADEAKEPAEAAPDSGASIDDQADAVLAALLQDDDADAAPKEDASAAETAQAAEEDAPVDENPEAASMDTDADDAVAQAEAESPAETKKPLRRLRIRKVRRKDAETPAPIASDMAAQTPEDVNAETVATKEAPVEETIAATDLEADDEADLMAELAAIEAELDRDSTGDADELHEDATDETATVEQTPPAATSQEETDDEDAFLAELAALREDETGDADTRPAEAAEDLAAAAAPEDGGAEDPADLERLFAATDSRLSGEDTSRRHANISHLKAAVAARRADGPRDDADQDDTSAYREDLANTVRPRRTQRNVDAQTERPEQRVPPLVLVSEQRIEDDDPVAAEPVTPRRAPQVEDEADATLPETVSLDDFEEFAHDVGAVDLADILEAAAVYSAKVMGQDTFSRPRLLHLAAEAVDDMSREDGLRGFGQLLREGKLRKVSRGTFELAVESRFEASAARAAG